MMRKFLLTLSSFALTGLVLASAPPSPEEFLGYPVGKRFTPTDRIVGYFRALESSSPRVRVYEYGRTTEHRPLICAVITSKENQERIEQIRNSVASLSEPASITATEAEKIASTSPVIVFLAFGVHGNESSSSEASMLLASRLAEGGPAVEEILTKSVIIIDPVQNPDGRERYVQWYRQTRNAEPDPNPDAIEHHEPWPGGRYNHYLMDMNRDWAFGTQQESRDRIALYRRWNPQVFVDFHEMGYESSYFFPPAAAPINTNIGDGISAWLETFGRANAAAFGDQGWPFFVGERFDLFYPGYGDSWPSLHGAVGMTYEMAGGGSAGLAVRREDGSILTLADRAEHHAVAAMTTLATAATHRHDLLLHTYRSMTRNIRNGPTAFLLPPGSPNREAVVEILVRQGVRLEMLTAPVRIRAASVRTGTTSSEELPPGTIAVPTSQPLGALVRSLLERSPEISEPFLSEQRVRVDADEKDEFYDITAWSLPLAANVDAFTAALPAGVRIAPYVPPPAPGVPATGKLGYLVDGLDPHVYAVAGKLLRDGIRFSVSEAAFRQKDRTFARGSVVILRRNNRPDLDDQISRIARETGAAFASVDAWWSGGLSLGSEKIRFVKDPRIALVGGAGIAPGSVGTIWHTLEEETATPHTIVALDALDRIDIGSYRVLILPDGSGYGDLADSPLVEKLKQWIRSGGTLVAIERAAAFLRKKNVEISKLEEAGSETDGEKAGKKQETGERYNKIKVPGAAFATEINSRSFLTFGVPTAPEVLITGGTFLRPAPHTIDNIVTIRRSNPLSSGFAWPESISDASGSPYLVAEPFGAGRVITFVDQPYFRLFWKGTFPLLMNAILYSPSFPNP